MAQVRSRENTFKVDLSNFPKRPSIEELQKFVLVKLGLAVGQVKRFQVNHAQNCVHVKCSELKVAQDTVAMHNGKHVMEINKTKVTVRLVMEDGGVEVKIHDLSENVSNDDIVAFLRHFGDVLSIREVSWGEGFLSVACHQQASGYASVLNGVAPDTNTLLPEFSGTILGPVIPQRPIRPESTGTAPNAPQSGAATSATGHSADGSLNISGDGTSSVQTSGSTNVAEHSAGSEASGGGTSSEVSNTLASETEVSAGSVATAIEGGALNDRPNESELASTSDMILIPLPPAAPAAEGDNKETEEMETESPSAADDAAELNTPHPKLPCEEDDAEMPAVSDPASCESVSPFEFPVPIPAPIPHPDLKKTHSLSSISGTESEGSVLSGFNVLTNVDDSRRGTAIALKSHIRFSNVRRSLDTRIIAVTLRSMVTICNVYAPSGTVNAASRERLFNNTLPLFLQNCSDHCILGGDFNCVIASKDATGTSNHSLVLKNLTSNLGLKDAWEVLKANQIAYSFIRPNCSSRLDRLFVSGAFVPGLRTAEYLVTSFTDHKAFKVRCCLPDQGRPTGNGFWSMRAHVLTEENLEEFELKWNRWLREKQNFNSWIEWWIRCAKPRIKSFFRWKTNEAFRQFNVANELLYGQLRAAYDNLTNNPAMVPEINRIKGKMLLLQNNFSKAFERLNDKFLGDEKLSTFQLGDRAGRKKNSTISSIKHQGRLLEDSAEVEDHIFDYFRQLYSAEDVQLNRDFPSNRLVDPNSEANNRAMEEITTEEIFTAIQTSASRKSPGCDGIPKEFYVKAFNIIHRQLNLILNEALRGGFPEQFLDGVVVLSKKKTNLETIKAYRPITLLNYDYKLLARILKVRLERIINENRILNSCQKCSNARRDIFEAVHAIKDRVVELNCKRKTGKLISFDLDHAFDRVDHTYLLSVLRSMRINENLVALIGRLMCSARSRIIINGNLSAQFPIQRSVRQGDPLSMLLFVVFLHPLLEKLLAICNHPKELVVAYADDISIILVDETKLAEVKRAFDDFGLCSGGQAEHSENNCSEHWTAAGELNRSGLDDGLRLCEDLGSYLLQLTETNDRGELERNHPEDVPPHVAFQAT
ncbi:hypothetical protein quinque_002432 [Culex quinquefasciatus]